MVLIFEPIQFLVSGCKEKRFIESHDEFRESGLSCSPPVVERVRRQLVPRSVVSSNLDLSSLEILRNVRFIEKNARTRDVKGGLETNFKNGLIEDEARSAVVVRVPTCNEKIAHRDESCMFVTYDTICSTVLLTRASCGVYSYNIR